MILSFINAAGGTVSGGAGGNGVTVSLRRGASGAGVANSGTILALTNNGAISGGAGGGGEGFGGMGANGVSNSGMIKILANGGQIVGGAGGSGQRGIQPPGNGGEGVSNGGVLTQLINSSAIRGGDGGNAVSANAGAGGAGMANNGTIATLTNSGTITGGNGGNDGGPSIGAGGAGGAGVLNRGTIANLTNTGTISGGIGGTGPMGNGAAGYAILSAGTQASIGPITNTGQVIGAVEIDNQANVTITGGTGAKFGSWTGGMITIGNGNLTFAGGKTALGDNVSVNGGAGTVTDAGTLRLAAPVTIEGNFAETASGVLDSVVAGDANGQYGSLAVTSLATLDGRLALDLTSGFTLAAGEVLDLLTFAGVGGDFTSFSFNGVACSASLSDVWSCSNLTGLYIEEVFGAGFLDLAVVSSAATIDAATFEFLADDLPVAVPEPSTWAMLGAGFLSLSLLSQIRRKMTTAA